jgi:hypothetical protein
MSCDEENSKKYCDIFINKGKEVQLGENQRIVAIQKEKRNQKSREKNIHMEQHSESDDET